MKKLAIGVLAHVDSGKTTLSEALLYKTGEIRTLGRVDHGDSFLDGNELERNRGITIFSKQAVIEWNDMYVTLLDTPGHVDFSAEMERTLSALDYAILVISASDGVQSHTETLWKLLKRYGIPVFVFVNKMDLAVRSPAEIRDSLEARLGAGFVDFSAAEDDEAFLDQVTMNSEGLTEMMLEKGTVTAADIGRAVAAREVYPCYFGSALKLGTGRDSVDRLLDGLERYTLAPEKRRDFGARAFKISRDENGTRLTFIKVTGGSIHVRDPIGDNGDKVNQIRIYSGMKYQLAEGADQGMVCALTGLDGTRAGDGLGTEEKAPCQVLEPFLTYKVMLPREVNPHGALEQLKQLSEEDPALHIGWNQKSGEIEIQIMGQVQLEVLAAIVRERFGYEVTFDQGRIVYKETILNKVEGVGHFEPLRHYAEVHLIMEPAERGFGIEISTVCSEDELDRNWQRLILSHVLEKEHLGVLTGAPVTDIRITLAAGRASRKHTEGGDFRQATYRAVRNGLMQAESALLEPWFEFTIEVPTESIGRAMSDVQKMGGSFQEPVARDDVSLLNGRAPASEMKDYQTVLNTYSRGRGRISCAVSGYELCHDQERVVAESGYDPERDVENTADSVFCDHGSGDIVKWDQVREFMHIPPVLSEEDPLDDEEYVEARARDYGRTIATDKELMDIFERTYGPVKSRHFDKPAARVRVMPPERYRGRERAADRSGRTFVLVDGYNLIHAWDEMEQLAARDFGAAREKLIDRLCNYQGFTRYEVIVVFDAYKVKGGIGSSEKFRNINVVYTKEAETADMYIEKTTHEMARKHTVRVVTSDGLEQLIIMGHGALRTSSREFVNEMKKVEEAILSVIGEYR
jgi:ribosomal protection tetracycline resistance protein